MGVAIDLLVGQPLGARSAIGTQQSQMGAVDMEAPTTVVVRSLQAQDDIPSAADAEEQIRQPSQVVTPVLERDGIKTLLGQQRADIVIERCRCYSAADVRQVRRAKGRELSGYLRLDGTLPQAKVYAGIQDLAQFGGSVAGDMGWRIPRRGLQFRIGHGLQHGESALSCLITYR